MLKKFTSWVFDSDGRRKRKREYKSYDLGFGWAMAEHLIHKKSIMELQSYIVEHTDSSFDWGAQDAIELIIESGLEFE